jgi:hypothetical protein
MIVSAMIGLIPDTDAPPEESYEYVHTHKNIYTYSLLNFIIGLEHSTMKFQLVAVQQNGNYILYFSLLVFFLFSYINL